MAPQLPLSATSQTGWQADPSISWVYRFQPSCNFAGQRQYTIRDVYQAFSGLTIHAGCAGEEGRGATIRHCSVRFDNEASGRCGTFVTLESRCRRGQDTAAAILVGETYTALAFAMATRDNPYDKLTSVGIDAVASSGQIVVTNAVLAVRELADWTSRAAVCGDAEAAKEK